MPTVSNHPTDSSGSPLPVVRAPGLTPMPTVEQAVLAPYRRRRLQSRAARRKELFSQGVLVAAMIALVVIVALVTGAR